MPMIDATSHDVNSDSSVLASLALYAGILLIRVQLLRVSGFLTIRSLEMTAHII